jgi:WD40 repeat protein
MLRRIAEEEPPAPRRIDPGIPRDLETIVRKAMAKDPKERYATALELADDLGRFLQSRPILARPPGAIDHAVKWVRRHKPATAAALSVLVLAAAVFAGALVWRHGELRRHNDELRSALKRAEENELATRRLWYDSQMRLAQQSLASDQIEFAQEIVEGLGPQIGRPDLRGFEWHYLRRLCHRDLSLLSTRESWTSAAAVAPDGQTLVTGHRDGVMVFWDLAGMRERARVRAHSQPVLYMSFSPDGRVLASSSTTPGSPSQLTLWNPSAAQPLAKLPQIAGYVIDPAFTSSGDALVFLEQSLRRDEPENRLVFWDLTRGPDHPLPGAAPIGCTGMAHSRYGRWVVTGALSGKVTLRDDTTGQARETLPRSFPWISQLAASDDGRTLAIAERTAITIWDVGTRREVGCVSAACSGPLAFSADGNRLACTVDGDRAIVLIGDVRTCPRRVPLERTSGKDLRIAFSPDGKKLAGAGFTGTAIVWDATSGRLLAGFRRESQHLGTLAFAPKGESLIVPSENGPIRCWHLVKQPEPLAQLAGHKAEVWGLAYTPDGGALISSADDHSIKVWDRCDGSLRVTLMGHTALVASLTIRHDGKLLASASFDNTVRLWDLPEGRPRAVLRGHTDRVRAVAFSPDGRLVASAGSDQTVRVWDVECRQPIQVFSGHAGAVRALAFDPTGALLVSASDDRTIRGIDVRGGIEAFSLSCPSSISAVAFSPDGSTLASADDLGYLTLWDASTWSMQRSVKGSDTGIWGLAFSRDGRTLAVACGDARVRLWDPLSGQVMLVLEGHTKRVNAVAFAPDGKTLASASHDGALRLWHAEQP